MPTLFRLITFLVVLAGLFYGAMFGLVWYVKPNVGTISTRVPLERLEANGQPRQTAGR